MQSEKLAVCLVLTILHRKVRFLRIGSEHYRAERVENFLRIGPRGFESPSDDLAMSQV